MDEILEELVPQETEELLEQMPEAVPQDLPEAEELPEEQGLLVEDVTPEQALQAVADVLVNYGGSGSVEGLAQALEQMMEGLLESHAVEVEQSRKAGMLTFALSQLVHDPGTVLALIDLEKVGFNPSNLADLRDFLDPIYQEKPYLFKTNNPLRGARIAQGVTGRALPTNGELGALSMEEYTAYRNARGSGSR